MLIRSQNKKYLVSTNNISFYVMDSEVICFGISGIEDGDYIILGHYETETKAMKVLDMIQEAYCKFMSVKNDDAWGGKESVFYMPADSKVEV